MTRERGIRYLDFVITRSDNSFNNASGMHLDARVCSEITGHSVGKIRKEPLSSVPSVWEEAYVKQKCSGSQLTRLWSEGVTTDLKMHPFVLPP